MNLNFSLGANKAKQVPKNDKGNNTSKEQDVFGELSNALASLSIADREKVFYDIHGVCEIRGESLEFKQEKLKELNNEVSKIVRGKYAFDMARSKCKEYVDDDDFRLLFLRKAEWDIRSAALNLVRYFNTKLEIFGEDLLTTTITQNDLSPGAKQVLQSGFIQALPVRDTAGRAVFFYWPVLLEKFNVSVEDQVACVWYIIMTASRDIETSIHGLVIINCMIGADRKKLEVRQAHQITGLSNAIPYKIRAGHICVDEKDDKFLIVMSIIKAADAVSKLRIKYHAGSHIEVKYALLTYGIPSRALPFSKHGEPTIDSHTKWLQRQKVAEEKKLGAEKRIDRYIIPSNKDVLSGRGRFVQYHIGNVHFRHLIAERESEYENCEDQLGAKGLVADKVIAEIQSSGGRFLKDDGVGWVLLGESAVHDKVTMAFRSLRKEKPLGAKERQKTKA